MQQFDGVFPELEAQQAFVEKVINEEEAGFFKTLATGLKLIDELELELAKAKSNLIEGEKAFELYDTFGFPLDLTQLIASEKGLKVDIDGFNKAMLEQKERSRNAEASTQSDWTIVKEGDLCEFVGYEQLEAKVVLNKYRSVEKKGKTEYHLVFDKSPFYAESGGQVGDTGYIQDGEEKTSILNTLRENQLIIHVANKLPNNVEAEFSAKVNKSKREATEKNHSATHLLHEALREVLGKHVEQRGSLVNESYLRFDFSHFQKMTEEELLEVENIVNAKIEENLPLEVFQNLPINEAKAMGAMALFGEKYGDHVRVIKFASSVELCGGTHVSETGKIKLFKIVSESSSAAGIRRIEAWTGPKVLNYYKEQETLLNAIKEQLKQSPKPLESIEKIQSENADLKKKLEEFSLLQQALVKADLLKSCLKTKMALIAL
ncbi:MAG: alanine--tRNA ligase-related protein [Chitinophagales bacterium]